MRERFRAWIDEKMEGRNGLDGLGYLTIVIYVLALVASNLTVSWIPLVICLFALIVWVYRMFSKDLEKRRKENDAFMNLLAPIAKLFRRKNKKLCCRHCGTKVTVKIDFNRAVTCPKCKRTIR